LRTARADGQAAEDRVEQIAPRPDGNRRRDDRAGLDGRRLSVAGAACSVTCSVSKSSLTNAVRTLVSVSPIESSGHWARRHFRETLSERSATEPRSHAHEGAASERPHPLGAAPGRRCRRTRSVGEAVLSPSFSAWPVQARLLPRVPTGAVPYSGLRESTANNRAWASPRALDGASSSSRRWISAISSSWVWATAERLTDHSVGGLVLGRSRWLVGGVEDVGEHGRDRATRHRA